MATRTERIAYGNGFLDVKVPERTLTVTARRPIPSVPDVEDAVREAIAQGWSDSLKGTRSDSDSSETLRHHSEV